MYGSQEKILGQKVNVKFFTVDPYSVGTGVPRPFSKFANYWKNIFLITALPAQISASNFHDLTQITQRRVRFNPKRTVFLCALG